MDFRLGLTFLTPFTLYTISVGAFPVLLVSES